MCKCNGKHCNSCMSQHGARSLQRALTQLQLDLGSVAAPLLQFYQVSSLNAALSFPVPAENFRVGSYGLLVNTKLRECKVQRYLQSAWRLKRSDGTQVSLGAHGPPISDDAEFARDKWQKFVVVRIIPLALQNVCCHPCKPHRVADWC